jgi:hypothetical protein
MNTKWVINIKDNEKLSNIPFSSYEVVRGGSKKRIINTRKKRSQILYSSGVYDNIPPSMITDLHYKKFLNKH